MADGTLGAPRAIASSGPTPYGFADHLRRHARRHRGVPGREGCRGGILVRDRRRVGRAAHRIGRQRPQRDLLGGDHARRPVRLHDELRRRRGLALRDRCRWLPLARGRDRRARRRRHERACATRTCPPTGASCTRSTPTAAASTAGASVPTGRSTRSGRGTACRRRWPGSRRAEDGGRRCDWSRSTPSPSPRPKPGAWRSRATPGPRVAASCWPRGARRGASRPATARPTSRASASTRALVPEFRGVLETDDGATILFEWQGLAVLTDSGMRRLLGSLMHTTDDVRYRWLNDRSARSRARCALVRMGPGSTWCSRSPR